MSSDDSHDSPDEEEFPAEGEPVASEGGTREELRKTRERLEEEADKAVTEFDQGIVDLLAWLLDTETRARIYVYLRQHENSTSDEVADGTGLYPSTVREALAELHEEGTVTRGKRENAGAGNNPYEYEAIAPSELVRGVVGDVQRELNTVFNLDDKLGGGSEEGDLLDANATGETDPAETEPVTITVQDADDDEE
jgi:predicted transcriptional regulator